MPYVRIVDGKVRGVVDDIDITGEHIENGYIHVSPEIFAICQEHGDAWPWNGTTFAPPVVPVHIPTPDELRLQVIAAAQDYLDTPANKLGFDGILSLCTYATDPDASLRLLGQAGVTFRSQVWQYFRQLDADVKAGTRTFPDIETLWAELPDPPEVLITGQPTAMQTLFTRFKSFLGL